VVVAHRPSVIAAVDLILVMANGRAQALGPKDEVLGAALRRRGVAAAMLLTRSFTELLHVNSGFNPSHVLTMRTSLPDTRYTDGASMARA